MQIGSGGVRPRKFRFENSSRSLDLDLTFEGLGVFFPFCDAKRRPSLSRASPKYLTFASPCNDGRRSERKKEVVWRERK